MLLPPGWLTSAWLLSQKACRCDPQHMSRTLGRVLYQLVNTHSCISVHGSVLISELLSTSTLVWHRTMFYEGYFRIGHSASICSMESKVWLVILSFHLGLSNGFMLSVCIPLFNPQEPPLKNILVHRKQLYTPPKCGQPPRPYGVPPPKYGVPPNGPNYFSPPSGFSPPPRPPGLAPRPVSKPPSPQKRTPQAISCGLAICLVVVLSQTLLMISRIDLLEPLMDIESATRHASMENSTLTLEKGNTENEREAMTRERKLWEKAKEDRVPHGAFWEDVWPAYDCRAYGKREYWGVLRNIPEGWSATDACMNMPVEIKGVTVRRPYRCAYVWGSPYIHGYWMVDWDQPDCKPWYRDYKDAVGPNRPFAPPRVCLHTLPDVQGCTGYRSGKRRIEAQIVGINNRREQNWWLLCNTTPLIWNLITYTSPTHCEERVGDFPF